MKNFIKISLIIFMFSMQLQAQTIVNYGSISGPGSTLLALKNMNEISIPGPGNSLTVSSISSYIGQVTLLRFWSNNLALSKLIVTNSANLTDSKIVLDVSAGISLGTALTIIETVNESNIIGTPTIELVGNTNNLVVNTIQNVAGKILLTLGTAGPLPVKLISFNAKAQENHVLLNWSTSSEINSQGFDIERSENGRSFEKLGFVRSNGTSNEKLGYEFLDETPPPGIGATDASGLFYRLKMLDMDGKFEYSPTKFVKIEGKVTINIFPNPATDFVNIQSDGQEIKSVKLLNTSGSIIYQKNSAIDKIDLTERAPGLYFLRIEKMDGKVAVKKLMKN